MKIGARGLILGALTTIVLLAVSSYGFYKLGEKAGSSIIPIGSVWMEDNGKFGTSDVARAQEHVPFTIILPTYIPSNNNKQILPMISGTIHPSSLEPIEIRITYFIQSLEYITITERNHPQVAGLSTQPSLEKKEINGKQVLVNKSSTIFYFDSTDAGITVNFVQVPSDEILKVVESMLQQTK